ncbi:Serine/threonine-protein kinase HT1 [Leucoagaricus sp. SymC.cos]|nr:Serine/threonine-protein kinase HT1 [Leucoagaricus sp. SymC.cos]
MLTRQSSLVFEDTETRLDTQPDLSMDDESVLVNVIIQKSRPGASAYLLKIKEALRHSGRFLELLRVVKELKDKRLDPPSFIRTVAENLQELHSLPELISDSIIVLPSDCSLEVRSPNRRGSFVVTIRYPTNTNVPEHVVCRRGPRDVVGFFGHPGPIPKSSPQSGKSKNTSLKRKRSANLRRDEALVLDQEGFSTPHRMETRRSKRLRLAREAEHSRQMSQSPPVTSRSVKSKLTVAAVVTLFTETLSNRTKRRRLMEYKEEKAQLVLDTMQALVDVPDIIPSSRLKLKQGLIKLSAESALPPTCFSLCGLAIDDFSPSDAPEGSFGEIYSGIFHEQRLCVKVVRLRHKSNMDKAVKAFLKEGVTWGQINHPNILPFYGIYRLQDKYNRLSLVSPWLENGNVNLYLENHPTANRLLLCYDIIQGILYLHKEGIVHGDLKGPNVLATRSGRACIADFGLATMSYERKPNWTSLRSSVAIGGTLRWQAPELLEFELSEPTASADVYAFGSIMYEIFTGQIPFHEICQQVRVMKAILEGKRPTKPVPIHPAWTKWGLSEDIWELMEECWETEPEQRPVASKVVQLITKLGPGGRLDDTRPASTDEYLSPSAFRHAVHAKLSPLSEETVERVVEWLREEERSGLRR